MRRYMIISDYYTGKILRKVKLNDAASTESIQYRVVEDKWLKIYSYYNGDLLQKINVSKYGSISIRFENKEDF